MRVLVTRPEPQATRTARRLSAGGFDPVIAPLLVFRALADPPVPEGPHAAVLLTSQNAVRALSGHRHEARVRALPAFCVGDATADAARAAGFPSVESAAGTARDLARLVRTRLSPPAGGWLPPAAGVSTVEDGAPPAADGLPSAAEGAPPATNGLPPAAEGGPPATNGLPPAAAGAPPAADGLPPAAAGAPPAADGLPPAAAGAPPATNGLPPAADRAPTPADGLPPATDGVATRADAVPPAAHGVRPPDGGAPRAAEDAPAPSGGVPPSTDGMTPAADGASPPTRAAAPPPRGMPPPADGDPPPAERARPAVSEPATRPRLLAVTGRDKAADLAGELTAAGIPVDEVALYAMEPATTPPDAMTRAPAPGERVALTLYSPRTAATFAALLRADPRLAWLQGVPAVCLSEAVARPVRTAGLARVVVAERPDEDALLDRLAALRDADPPG